jgi:23S rRNA (pseudouridine1915-N3)-methyltransferase
MKILILAIDKVSSSAIQELINEYLNRVKHFCNVDLVTITMPKNVRYKSIEEQKLEEQKALIKHISDSDKVILLDEKGNEMNSEDFAKWIEKNRSIHKRMVFVIGGPYGFSEEFKKQFPYSISLSKMTFSHEMVRVIFLEQLYRSFSILHNQKYHHK